MKSKRKGVKSEPGTTIDKDLQVFENGSTKLSVGTLAYERSQDGKGFESYYVPLFPYFYKSQNIADVDNV